MTTTPSPATPTRRRVLAGLAGVAGLPLAGPLFARAAEPPVLIAQAVCTVIPQATEGPFYFDPALERADIREDRAGVPLALAMQVVGVDCRPLPGVRVDVWHCDATGAYSGYRGQGDGRTSTEGATFLRGTQFADGGGVARFQTIYPGWYRGRTTHIHFKVFLADDTLVTAQAYFPDALSDRIYAEAAPYDRRAAGRDTWNANDGVLARSGAGDESVYALAEASGGYEASLVVGVAG
ncbi:MAG: intradiol ring-cleavage dioxygenase [Alphaproteobacteria bacterium]